MCKEGGTNIKREGFYVLLVTSHVLLHAIRDS